MVAVRLDGDLMDPAPLAGTFAMWMIMMAAMMLPAVFPWVVVLGRVASPSPGRSAVRSGAAFLGGYFAAWMPYALAGAALQLVLQSRGLLHGPHLTLSGPLAAFVFIGAGAFQFSPLKDACLRHCRSPLGFFLSRWNDGPAPAWILGMRHGVFCLACCWALMAVAFAVGVMSIVWMAVVAGAILIEQVAPGGRRIARLIGLVLLVRGAVSLI